MDGYKTVWFASRTHDHNLTPVQLETLLLTTLLEVSIGRDFGALKGLTHREHMSITFCIADV